MNKMRRYYIFVIVVIIIITIIVDIIVYHNVNNNSVSISKLYQKPAKLKNCIKLKSLIQI